MSKSLGNLIMVSDLLQTYAPDALRLYLAAHHYREAWSYAEKDLQKSQALGVESGKTVPLNPAEYASQFSAAMENDLDTPGAVQALAGLAQAILEAAQCRRDVQEAQAALRKYGQVLGLTFGANGPRSGWSRGGRR